MDTRVAWADVSGVVENDTSLARSLPSEAYTSQAYLDAELDRLFLKEWLYACPLALLPIGSSRWRTSSRVTTCRGHTLT